MMWLLYKPDYIVHVVHVQMHPSQLEMFIGAFPTTPL